MKKIKKYLRYGFIIVVVGFIVIVITAVAGLMRLEYAAIDWSPWTDIIAVLALLISFSSLGINFLIYRLHAGQTKESRFDKALDQINSKHVSTRLSGLYLLDTMAQKGKMECRRVWDELAIYLRYPPPLSVSGHENNAIIGSRPDVAEIAKMLGEAYDRYPNHNTQTLNLSRVNLKGADFRKSRIKRTSFHKPMLKGAGFLRVNFEGANLSETHLEMVDLRLANFKGADLSAAHLEVADLQEASFDQSSQLSKTVFDNTNVSNCDLSQVKDLNIEQLKGMVWIKGRQAPKLPHSMSRQTIRCITKKEWKKIKAAYIY